MSKQVRITYAKPGTFLYYPLNTVIHPTGKMGFDEWGICECTNLFWIGEKDSVKGVNVLRLSLLDILDKRDEIYPDWGDEEMYLSVGLDGTSGEFKWFLLNEEQFKLKDEMFERIQYAS